MNEMQYEPEVINDLSKIYMLNSPIYEKLYFEDPDMGTPITGTHIRLKLWYWKGNYNDPFVNGDEPNVILYKEKINTTDNHILFEISDYIKDELEPTFYYSSFNNSMIQDSILFYKYEYDIIDNPTNDISGSVVATFDGYTRLGVLGWNWNYESIYTSYQPFNSFRGSFNEFIEPNRGYNPNIRNFKTTFIPGSTTAAGYISYIDAPKTGYTVCAKEPYLIVYLNKNGLWDYFTPTGKVVISEKIKKENYNRAYSDPTSTNPGISHFIRQFNTETKTEIILNTGIISQNEGQLVEEILYSPRVYLIRIRPEATLSGGYYNSYQNIPVIATDSDFERKTRLNNKGKISYNIKFETTTNKIQNIR